MKKMAVKKSATETSSQWPLPKDVKVSDLQYPSYKGKDKVVYMDGPYGPKSELAQFDLWYVEGKGFGWCIPVLLIAHAGRRQAAGTPDRHYAISTESKQVVRIGRGPHVKRTVTVYVRESRLKALSHYLELKKEGAEKAGMTRDRISSRRVQGQMERAQGHSYWRWNI